MHDRSMYARHSQLCNVLRSKMLLGALTLFPMDMAIAMGLIQPSCAVVNASQKSPLWNENSALMMLLLAQLSSIGVPNEEQNRRQLRELLFTAPGIEDHISGVVSACDIAVGCAIQSYETQFT